MYIYINILRIYIFRIKVYLIVTGIQYLKHNNNINRRIRVANKYVFKTNFYTI